MEKTAAKVKIIVVGQTPPPFHGQAIMIDTMLKGKYENFDMIHVRMDFSENIDEIGSFQFKKIGKLFILIRNILKTRRTHNAQVLYFPPAGDDVNPILRDIVVLSIVRPFFEKTIFHFHAAGLMDGFQKLPRLFRPLFRLAYNKPYNCLNLSEKLPPISHFIKSEQHTVIPHGIEDPTNGFIRKSTNPIRQILFVGAVRESKGVQTLLEAAKILNDKGTPFKINIVGEFASNAFKNKASEFIATNQLTEKVQFHGLLKGEEKWEQYKTNDIFCFPTFYENESFGIVLVEALAYGLPVVTSNWRATTDIIQEPENGYQSKTKDSADLASKLDILLTQNDLSQLWEANRKRFIDHYTTDIFTKNIDAKLLGSSTSQQKAKL